MIDKMYNSEEFINFEDFNIIEEKIKSLNTILKEKCNIINFTKKVWELNEFPYIEEISRIECGIKDIGYYFYKPTGWIECKSWNAASRKMIFDYSDPNRWINNLNLIFANLNDEVTLWNGQSFINWNTKNDLEWEE